MQYSVAAFEPDFATNALHVNTTCTYAFCFKTIPYLDSKADNFEFNKRSRVMG